ncbi:MAG TPA: bifunctional diaminohydroxyphosphoribosylaminopyrimidine deaminase/5-amino-6-(5-phosphoribosylamino)uracil reductase RibD [Ilumatobacter sp.]|nr:bifunctional diaminohydroxyphosphoribosylaminopyrimidine deaminase/5-amino-6-(5-phosphoribosylamino)uracil reductase RibD [Ilumatobacter sp.]
MNDESVMRLAIEQGASARTRTSPNPWVGAVVVADGAVVGVGATQPPGGAHAEVMALATAAEAAHGATLVVTLEPCAHHGRTGPCVDAIVRAGVARVVVGTLDPDHRVAGTGVAALRAAGIQVDVGVLAEPVVDQLQPYLVHRSTGRPYVVCKMAASIDGGTAAPDGTSQWITGAEARRDVHQLRAESDAIVVGAGTVRIDDPALTVRHVDGRDPLRVVLGSAPAQAKVRPCLEWTGDLAALLDELGARGILQVLVEGGQRVVRAFHDLDLIDRYVIYIAPALFGGTDKVPLLAGPTTPTISELWRGEFVGVRPIGTDIRIDLIPTSLIPASLIPTSRSTPTMTDTTAPNGLQPDSQGGH